MPILSPAVAGPYPTIEQVFNLARVFLNDTFAGATNTLGEGRIFTDTWTPNLTILNEALAELQRDLANLGVPRTTKEVFILDLPYINGPRGPSIADCTVQTFLSYGGYWDGSTLWTSFNLPVDLYQPIRIWQRATNTGTTFGNLEQADDGLKSIYQDQTLGGWDWRGDALYFNGSIVNIDIRIKYEATIGFYGNIAPTAFSTTMIPFLDSLSALAYRCAYIFADAREPGTPGSTSLLANYQAETGKMANRHTRQRQRTRFRRPAYGSEAGAFGWFQ